MKKNATPVSTCGKEEILYKKVGRRYVPIGVSYERGDMFPLGSHLVVVSDERGGRTTSYRYRIDPDFAPLAAALRLSSASITDIILEATKASFSEREKLTKEQRAAWMALQDTYGGRIVSISYPSAQEASMKIVQALVNTVIKECAPRSHEE